MLKGTHHSLETKRKMIMNHADFSGEKSPHFGKHLSLEIREKISKSKMGHKHTEEAKEKIRIKTIILNENPEYRQNKRMSLLGRRHSEEAKKKMSEARKDKKLTEEHRKKLSESHMGQISWCKGLTYEKDSRILAGNRNGNWQGGKSFEPYGIEFNDRLKSQIRARDNNQCQLCSLYENGRTHPVHHIDYCKKNNKPENLITLCLPCHNKTNLKRDYWRDLFGGRS